ncbi:hypothetical protein EYS42_15015 [Aquabacterium lacunae]|uniref:Glycosyl transferase family 28 C-terminal domain-containing protein n=1 Tax=Aquabacterium lacunae TaxID=2528630 RepID=A0A4Q9GV62_9BURK|nr:glycosyltransferase [Aquabacterium lacunae]TBO28314.1 hypothetical protein EYS42_15015 [Aquabacterium lacunae]
MIFLTVGTQLGFDRLVKAMDEWASGHSDIRIFGQIGPGRYKPRHFEYARFVTPQETRDLTRGSKLIVAHAGIGSIVTALSEERQILVMPRLAERGEHRNDHQLATARKFVGRQGVTVAFDEKALKHELESFLLSDNVKPKISRFADEELLNNIRSYLAHIEK